MTEKSIQQILSNQMTIPMKLLTSYKSLGLSEEDVIILIQIHRYIQIGNDFPTPTEIASNLTISEDRCIEKLRLFIQKNFLELKELKNEQNQWSEAYSLDPLWHRLFLTEETEENEEGQLFIFFEQEFGRPLSPFEIETISVWLDTDQIAPELIITALREAVLMGKLNFKYIDRILREWKRKGVQTVEQARTASESFRQGQVKKQYKQEKRDTSVYYNWLDGGK